MTRNFIAALFLSAVIQGAFADVCTVKMLKEFCGDRP